MKRQSDDRCCALCRHSTELALAEELLCKHCGVVPREHICTKFVYEPLKRRPRRLTLEPFEGIEAEE